MIFVIVALVGNKIVPFNKAVRVNKCKRYIFDQDVSSLNVKRN